jgi:predicted CXXCH cytochrome family protein
MKKLILSLFIIATSPTFAMDINVVTSEPTQTAESEDSGCSDCHQKTYSFVTMRNYPHPGAIKNCKTCHIKQTVPGKKIDVATHSMETLVFLEVEDKISYSVRVRVKDRADREAVSGEVKFMTSTVTTNITNDNMPPLISNFRVEELNEGVFYSVVLAWDTNELSTTAMEYGLKGAPVTLLSMGDQCTMNHRISLSGLMSGKVYIFRGISKDPFGNTARTEDLLVKVENPFSNKKAEPDVIPSVEDVSVVKVVDKTALRWKSNKETAAVVELSEVVSSEKFSKEPHYPGLTDLPFSGLDGCMSEGCHKATGNLEWNTAKPSGDLPLLKGYIMLCTTCHTPHGGEYSYILRKDSQELCISCH